MRSIRCMYTACLDLHAHCDKAQITNSVPVYYQSLSKWPPSVWQMSVQMQPVYSQQRLCANGERTDCSSCHILLHWISVAS